MESTGRRDITATVEVTSSVELSHNLTTVTTEIKAYQSIGGQAIFEIGRRLKWVKENDLTHGEFGKWLDSIQMNQSTANKFVKIVDEFPNSESVPNLGWAALYQIATMPVDERDKPQKLDSGEIKKPDEMTVRELRETKGSGAKFYFADNNGKITRKLNSKTLIYQHSILFNSLILTKLLPVDKLCTRTLITYYTS